MNHDTSCYESVMNAPSGVVASRYCNECNHGLDKCTQPEGLRCTGDYRMITRELTRAEALDEFKRLLGYLKDAGTGFLTTSGEQVTVKFELKFLKP